jgi:hypothetical protein
LAVPELLPIEAVISADWEAVNVFAAAVNEAEAALAGTVTDAGTVTTEELLVSAMVAPPTAAGWESATVHVELALGARLAGAHCKELMTVGGTSDTVALLEDAFKEAVIVAVCGEEILPVLAVKVAEPALAATVTDAGTVIPAPVPVRVTTTPPAGAAFDSVTVQEVLAFDVRLAAAHWSAVTSGGAESVRDAVAEEVFSDAVTMAV